MRIVSVGFLAPDYLISLANALVNENDVMLFLSQQNLARYFPEHHDLERFLQDRHIVDPKVSLRLVDYPKGSYLQKLRIAWNLKREIDRIQPDIIHYQSGGDPWFPLIMLWLRHYPFVVTIHDVFAHPGGSTSFMFQAIKNFLISHLAHQIIVHGQQQADSLTQNYFISSNKVNAIPIGSYNLFATRIDPQITTDDRSVLFFGGFRANKGIDVLLRAAPLIAHKIPDVRFIIAGEGNYPTLYQKAAEHPDWFEIKNRFIEAEEVHELFQRAALVVLPYIEASQSGVIPLAYLFGRPVVATRVGSIPEAVEDGKTGFLVEPGDENALAEAIVCLLQDVDLRKSMGAAAKNKLDNEMSWNAIATKTLSVYEQCKFYIDKTAYQSCEDKP